MLRFEHPQLFPIEKHQDLRKAIHLRDYRNLTSARYRFQDEVTIAEEPGYISVEK